jgi:hypothetical protein
MGNAIVVTVHLDHEVLDQREGATNKGMKSFVPILELCLKSFSLFCVCVCVCVCVPVRSYRGGGIADRKGRCGSRRNNRCQELKFGTKWKGDQLH